jgi:phosphinothricin acetyltransferase
LPWLVAEDDKEIVGYAYATRWHDRSAYRYTVEVSAYLANTACSKGWGTQLYTALFEVLRRLDIHVVIAGIALPNQASVALHEKFGMEKVANFSEVGFKFGRWIDVGHWQVRLHD